MNTMYGECPRCGGSLTADHRCSTLASTPDAGTPRTVKALGERNEIGLYPSTSWRDLLECSEKLERELSALRAAHEVAQAEIAALRVAFAHFHVNYGDGSDTCKQCGLDLRDPVHFTEYKDKQIAKHAARRKP